LKISEIDKEELQKSGKGRKRNEKEVIRCVCKVPPLLSYGFYVMAIPKKTSFIKLREGTHRIIYTLEDYFFFVFNKSKVESMKYEMLLLLH
jgi:mRNA-degrading endonuclease RelE of RelBE toxin-antitoxin system